MGGDCRHMKHTRRGDSLPRCAAVNHRGKHVCQRGEPICSSCGSTVMSSVCRSGNSVRWTFLPGITCTSAAPSVLAGCQARLAYHAKRRKTRRHWHIDYLREHGELEEAWIIACPVRLEHAWVSALSAAPDVQPVAPGFGASDSPYTSHLFFSPVRPSPHTLAETLFQGIEQVSDCITHLSIEVHTFHDRQLTSA